MQVGFFQFAPRFGKVEQNHARIMEKLRQVQADVVVLPELPFTGYNFADRDELMALAEDPARSEIVQELSWLCATRDLHIVTGFAERSGDKIYNSALLIGPLGVLHTYRKIHLFMNEKQLFTPGDVPLEVHEIKGMRLGIMVCFDWAFPEVARNLALKGADVICHPSNLVLFHCHKAMVTRAVENGVYVVTANRYGVEKRSHGKIRFNGRSQIIGPRGNILYRAKAQKQEMQIREIDISLARNKLITESNDLLRDRRPTMY